MQLTKYDHSGFYLEQEGRGLLFDPVEYEHQLPPFTNIDVIVITHKHGDYCQPEVLAKILEQNPSAKVLTTSDNSNTVPSAVAVKPGDTVQVSVFNLTFFGSGNHASIYNGEIPCENIGVIVNGTVVNPGDSFDMPSVGTSTDPTMNTGSITSINSAANMTPTVTSPTSSPEVLLVPISAPWLKTEESIKYIETLRPRIAINAHDGLLSEMGLTITNNWTSEKSKAVGTEYKFLSPGEGITIDTLNKLTEE